VRFKELIDKRDEFFKTNKDKIVKVYGDRLINLGFEKSLDGGSSFVFEDEELGLFIKAEFSETEVSFFITTNVLNFSSGCYNQISILYSDYCFVKKTGNVVPGLVIKEIADLFNTTHKTLSFNDLKKHLREKICVKYRADFFRDFINKNGFLLSEIGSNPNRYIFTYSDTFNVFRLVLELKGDRYSLEIILTSDNNSIFYQTDDYPEKTSQLLNTEMRRAINKIMLEE